MPCNDNNKIAKNCLSCVVRKSTIFGSLTDDEMASVEGYIEKKRHFQSGEYVIQENSSVNYSLCINSGYLILGSYLENGSRQIFQVAMPGDSIGFSHSNADYNYFVQAMTEVDVCVISNVTVDKLIGEQKAIATKLIEILSHNTAVNQQYLLNLGRKSAREALAYLIMDISTRIRQRLIKCTTNESELSFFPLNQEDMADILGMTKVHISRITSEFKKEQLIQCSHKTIKVLDEDRLSEIGGFSVLG
ncbi:MAG: Crp/Fnr family transcriptional regulator [Candidatus Thioglobus sp.]|jgi:CRP/FNR family transcriptional regulator|nr:Crp/Fnr family transcriptional regulator [Candidatus Thioglobus sp.]MBT5783801.1 Crp/Fnr family transcriptional regulator [Candidatus Thioglobus sp.]